MLREEYDIFDLKELSRIIEKNLIPECCEKDVNSETLEQTEKFRNKRYEKSKNVLNNKQYKEPCMPTRHYWRGNIK